MRKIYIYMMIFLLSLFTQVFSEENKTLVDRVVAKSMSYAMDSSSISLLYQLPEKEVILSLIHNIEHDSTYKIRKKWFRSYQILKEFNVIKYQIGRDFLIKNLSDSIMDVQCLVTLKTLPAENQQDVIEKLLPLLYGDEKGETFKEWAFRVLEKYGYQDEVLQNYAYQIFLSNEYGFVIRYRAGIIYALHNGIQEMLAKKSELNADGLKALTKSTMRYLIKLKTESKAIDSLTILNVKQFVTSSFEVQDTKLRINLMDLIGLTFRMDEYLVFSNNTYIPNPEIYDMMKKASVNETDPRFKKRLKNTYLNLEKQAIERNEEKVR